MSYRHFMSSVLVDVGPGTRQIGKWRLQKGFDLLVHTAERDGTIHTSAKTMQMAFGWRAGVALEVIDVLVSNGAIEELTPRSRGRRGVYKVPFPAATGYEQVARVRRELEIPEAGIPGTELGERWPNVSRESPETFERDGQDPTSQGDPAETSLGNPLETNHPRNDSGGGGETRSGSAGAPPGSPPSDAARAILSAIDDAMAEAGFDRVKVIGARKVELLHLIDQAILARWQRESIVKHVVPSKATKVRSSYGLVRKKLTDLATTLPDVDDLESQLSWEIGDIVDALTEISPDHLGRFAGVARSHGVRLRKKVDDNDRIVMWDLTPRSVEVLDALIVAGNKLVDEAEVAASEAAEAREAEAALAGAEAAWRVVDFCAHDDGHGAALMSQLLSDYGVDYLYPPATQVGLDISTVSGEPVGDDTRLKICQAVIRAAELCQAS